LNENEIEPKGMLAMISCTPPKNDVSSDNKNFTIASTFEKEKSLKFELLFGDYRKELIKDDARHDVINAVDYFFSPGLVFGFACQSYGEDFRNFHHIFVMRACAPGEKGNIIPGINPGAEILVKTLTGAASLRLRSILVILKRHNVTSKVPDAYYQKINQLLEAKMNLDYFVQELIGQIR
jgi:hypothetical protein